MGIPGKVMAISCTGAAVFLWFDYGLHLPRFMDDDRRVYALLNSSRVDEYRPMCVHRVLNNYPQMPVCERMTLAQRLDYGTHVMLAREGCTIYDYIPTCHLNKKIKSSHELNIQLKRIIKLLSKTTRDKCALFHSEQALVPAKRIWSPEEEILWLEDSKLEDLNEEHHVTPPPPDLRKLIIKLRALLAHSLETQQCFVMRESGVPDVLRHIWKHLDMQSESSIIIQTLILEILCNFSIAGETMAEAIIQAGWLTVARKLLDSTPINLEMALMSSKLLRNLQSTFLNERIVLSDGIHILYEPPKGVTPKCDIVFIHGLRGGIFRSWRQKDIPPIPLYQRLKLHPFSAFKSLRSKTSETQSNPVNNNDSTSEDRTRCWPKDWLPDALNEPVRIIGVDYNSSVTEWTAPCPHDLCRHSISKRAAQLGDRLNAAGVGDRKVLWVGHSMGGLLTKYILLQSLEKGDGMIDNCGGCVFIASPHKGAAVATQIIQSRSRHIWLPSVEISLIRENHPDLLQLDKQFAKLVKSSSLDVLNMCETQKTIVKLGHVTLGKYLMVPEKSCRTEYGKCVYINESHHFASKPQDKQSDMFRLVTKFLNDHM